MFESPMKLPRGFFDFFIDEILKALRDLQQ